MDDTLNINPTKPSGSAANPNPASGDMGSDRLSAARMALASLYNPDTPKQQDTLPAAPDAKPAGNIGGGLAIPGTSAEAQPLAATLAHTQQPGPKSDNVKTRPMPSRIKPIIAAVAVFAALLLSFKLPVLISQLQYKPAPGSANIVAPVSTVPANPIISIPKINVNAPIVFEPSYEEAKIQKALEGGVVHYGTTPLPGEAGNSVIVGHSSNDWWEAGNYKFVFVLLDKLVIGDTFSVNYNSKQYIYKVDVIKTVEPTDLSVLAPTPTPSMTLITCVPPGTAWKRLIIRGTQISPEPAKVTTSTPSTDVHGSLPGSAPSFWDQVAAWWSGLFGSNNKTEPTPSSLPRNL